MKVWIKKGIAAAVVAASAALAVGSSGSSSATVPGLPAFGITSDGGLMASFNTNTPGVLNWVSVPTGFVCGETFLIGIDFRVQDGQLYALGNRGCIYIVTLPPAPPPPVPVVSLRHVSQLSVPLEGTNFGVDFNPAADRLRIVGDTGQNLRHDLNTHVTAVDGRLSSGPNTATVTGISAAAYTNNDLNSSSNTTLFDINTTTDQVVIQSPANTGFVIATGSLGVDAGPNAGFDIFADLSGGKTISNTAFATLTVPGNSRSTLFTVELLTGTATSVGLFPLNISDIAVALDS
ncbi:MAG TPA: DUF4394 domain-containing protein [Actinophytocola sp.]|uniref:DUF4394 domain-containing protein n=1 Tax=Actinophytocola sp. TaxID=1872138 RepID=UPI002DDCC356|nr:DUF4394 domain-containing protein [Actinophytocola sp.]HEV2779257.1 DUF4394 domain-containing protein [Actinophytocola sp.]